MQSTNDAPCDYVIKVLRANCESDPVLVDTINREATAGRQLSHSHIISILAAHTRSFPYYVVMPRLEGATVRHAIDAVGPLVSRKRYGLLAKLPKRWLKCIDVVCCIVM